MLRQAVQTIHIFKHLLCCTKQDAAFWLWNGRQRVWRRFPSPRILAVDGCFELRVVTGSHRLADGYVLTEIGNQFCLSFGRTGSIALAGTATNAGACAAS